MNGISGLWGLELMLYFVMCCLQQEMYIYISLASIRHFTSARKSDIPSQIELLQEETSKVLI